MYSTGTCSMRQGCQQCRLQARCKSEWTIIVWCQMSNFYTPRKHSLGGVYRNRPVCPSVRLSGPTSTSFVRFPPNFVEFKIMMCELLQYKGFYCPLSFTPAISRQKHVTFIEIIMSTLYRTNTQRGIFYIINSQRQQSLHSDTFFLFQTIQSLLLLLNAACFGLTRPWLKHTIYCTPGKHTNPYTTDEVCIGRLKILSTTTKHTTPHLYKKMTTESKLMKMYCMSWFRTSTTKVVGLSFLMGSHSSLRISRTPTENQKWTNN